MSKFLLIGLGNIGAEYAHTRHNIGLDVLDAFVIKHGGFFKMDRLAEVAEVKWKGKVFICIKPTTFMNLSGKAFKYWMDKEKVDLENTLTIVDDLALPINKLRFGIGNNFAKGQQVDFVLGKWAQDERKTIDLKIQKSVEVIESFAAIGLARTMTMANGMDIKPE